MLWHSSLRVYVAEDATNVDFANSSIDNGKDDFRLSKTHEYNHSARLSCLVKQEN